MNPETVPSDLVALLDALVRTPSVNPPGNELAVATLLHDWLRARGVWAEVQPLIRDRANLTARVSGKRKESALAFCGHLDTVPLGQAAWSHDPFGAAVVGNDMYGRGTSDMKGALAAMAAALVSLARRNPPPDLDILFLATAGEEVDSFGAQRFLEQGVFEGVGAMIVGEPTRLDVAVAHKGALWVKVTIPGRTAHGSMPHLGSNAVLSAVRFLELLKAHRFEAKAHALLGPPTVSPNTITGGTAANVVPDRCEVTIDIRTLPGLSTEFVLQDLRSLLRRSLSPEEAAGSRLEIILDRAPVATPADAAIVKAAMEVSRRLSARTPKLRGVSYYTDASVIVASTGIPTILWGPGDDEQAHQIDEHVAIDQVMLARQLYEAVAIDYAGRTVSALK